MYTYCTLRDCFRKYPHSDYGNPLNDLYIITQFRVPPGAFTRSQLSSNGSNEWAYYHDVINGNAFPITGSLWGEFTGHQWILSRMTINMQLWWSLCTLFTHKIVEQTVDLPVILEAMMIVRSIVSIKTAVFVRNFKMIDRLITKAWAKEISRDLSFGRQCGGLSYQGS